MRSSCWSSDVCSSDLEMAEAGGLIMPDPVAGPGICRFVEEGLPTYLWMRFAQELEATDARKSGNIQTSGALLPSCCSCWCPWRPANATAGSNDPDRALKREASDFRRCLPALLLLPSKPACCAHSVAEWSVERVRPGRREGGTALQA